MLILVFYTEVSYPEFINSLPSPHYLSVTAFPIQSYKHYNAGQLWHFMCYMPTSVANRGISSINFWIKNTFFNVDQKHTNKLGHPRGYFYGPFPEMILYELFFLLPLVVVVNIISNKIAPLWSYFIYNSKYTKVIYAGDRGSYCRHPLAFSVRFLEIHITVRQDPGPLFTKR